MTRPTPASKPRLRPLGFAPPLRPLARCQPMGDAAAWGARDAAVVWHGFTQMACYLDNEPMIVESAEGRELIDVDGRRYLRVALSAAHDDAQLDRLSAALRSLAALEPGGDRPA